MTETLTFSDLKTLTGYTRQSDVERCLRSQHVPYLVGKDGPFTTMAALQQALGIRQDKREEKRIEF